MFITVNAVYEQQRHYTFCLRLIFIKKPSSVLPRLCPVIFDRILCKTCSRMSPFCDVLSRVTVTYTKLNFSEGVITFDFREQKDLQSVVLL